MMRPVQHTIKKFLLDLKLEKEDNAWQFQRQVATLIKTDLLPVINDVLSKQYPQEGLIRIKRIELDLGTIKGNGFDKDFIDRFLHKLREQLQPISLSTPAACIEGIDASYTPATISILQEFLHFLANGTVSFIQNMLDFKEWQQEILKAIQEQPQYFKEICARYAPHFKTMANRFVLQFEPAFAEELIKLVNPGTSGILSTIKELEKEPQPTPAFAVLKRKLRAGLFFNVLQANPQQGIDLATAFQKWLTTVVFKTPASPQIRPPDELVLLLQPVIDNNEWLASGLPRSNEQEAISDESKTSPETSKSVEPEDEPEKIFIDNAGLVLLHPFLPRFFETLQLVQGNQFVSEEAQYKAVHLLQYLVNGAEQMPEYCVSLNKIMCGLEAGQHLDRFLELTDAEKQEASELLQAVVEHWTALKNSSTGALQETFLQRDGKLQFIATDNYWKLQVEQKAVDILLDKLPWGYSYIHLPWMPYPLNTEWQ